MTTELPEHLIEAMYMENLNDRAIQAIEQALRERRTHITIMPLRFRQFTEDWLYVHYLRQGKCILEADARAEYAVALTQAIVFGIFVIAVIAAWFLALYEDTY